MSRSVLVTGGFGFIGSHLVERLLLTSDSRVHVVDDLSTSPIDVDGFVRDAPDKARLSYDLCSVEEFCARSTRPRFDQIYHLASVVGPVGVLRHGGRIAGMMVNDTARVAALAMESSGRLVDVSTSEVYGGGRDGYCSERDLKVIQPKVTVRLEYAVGKLAAEIALVNMTTISGLSASIVRPFNVAGPRQSGQGGFVLPRFIAQADAGEPLTVYGDGSMIRAFTHVEDIADGLLAVMQRGRAGEAYNLGNPANKTTILELARRVVRLTGSRSEIRFVDPKTLFGPLFEEANDKYPDADRSIHELGWLPKHDLDEIILDTTAYMRAGRRH
jgi:nucleoside-diphosphate-sugar epimerase